MPNTQLDNSSPHIELLKSAYAAFNARDIEAALPIKTLDVTWPRAFKGGFVCGPEEVRAYWAEQRGEIDPNLKPLSFHPDGSGRILVEVHQIVRDMGGSILADEHVGHLFTIEHDLVRGMEISPLPAD